MNYEEKRKSERKPCNIPIIIEIENKNATGILINLSEGGALIKLDDSYSSMFGYFDINKHACFDFSSHLSEKKISGNISRVLENSNEKLVVLSFS